MMMLLPPVGTEYSVPMGWKARTVSKPFSRPRRWISEELAMEVMSMPILPSMNLLLRISQASPCME